LGVAQAGQILAQGRELLLGTVDHEHRHAAPVVGDLLTGFDLAQIGDHRRPGRTRSGTGLPGLDEWHGYRYHTHTTNYGRAGCEKAAAAAVDVVVGHQALRRS